MQTITSKKISKKLFYFSKKKILINTDIYLAFSKDIRDDAEYDDDDDLDEVDREEEAEDDEDDEDDEVLLLKYAALEKVR